MARVIMPLPQRDFDPSEVAVSWRVLTGRGHDPHPTWALGYEQAPIGQRLDRPRMIERLRQLDDLERDVRRHAADARLAGKRGRLFLGVRRP